VSVSGSRRASPQHFPAGTWSSPRKNRFRDSCLLLLMRRLNALFKHLIRHQLNNLVGTCRRLMCKCGSCIQSMKCMWVLGPHLADCGSSVASSYHDISMIRSLGIHLQPGSRKRKKDSGSKDAHHQALKKKSITQLGKASQHIALTAEICNK